jgi:hypothetical protein
MSVQDYVYLSGKCKWAKGLFAPSAFKKYSVKLNLDNPSLSIVLDLKKQGVKNELIKDEDGYWVSLSRASEINVRGQLRAMLPPLAIDADGQPWNHNNQIGDGSDLTCKVAVRKWKSPFGVEGIALRLESIRVDNLVPFTTDNWPKEEARQIKGLAEAPQPSAF